MKDKRTMRTRPRRRVKVEKEPEVPSACSICGTTTGRHGKHPPKSYPKCRTCGRSDGAHNKHPFHRRKYVSKRVHVVGPSKRLTICGLENPRYPEVNIGPITCPKCRRLSEDDEPIGEDYGDGEVDS